ncbi:MAG: recombinase family protein [Thermoplasmatota archaeon]
MAGPRLDLAALLRTTKEHEPRIFDLVPPSDAARERAQGSKVYRVLTRVSDDKLLSIPQQIRECCAYASGEPVAGTRRPDSEKPGIVDRVYNFGEQSGFTLFESPLFQTLLRDAQGTDFDAFICRDSSRLGRDYWDKFATLGLLRRSGKELHILEDGGQFDWDDDMTKVRSWADTWSDSKKKMEEIRKSLRATERLREEGFPTTSVPFGYEGAWHPMMKRRVWKPSADAEKVRAIFERAARTPTSTAIPLTQIAFEVGVPKQLAWKILRNPVYTGGFRWHGELVRAAPDVVPPLISTDLFARVQDILKSRNKQSPHTEPKS